VKFYVDLAQKEGGKIALGGKAPEPPTSEPRRLFLPADGNCQSSVHATNREEISARS
jgi:hypothetical protein